ncbi:MAG TPA: hypothetical protein VJ892_03160 [Candidatus Absconditabacterales bacterium]|nr:hypothetical protein [Candidatus Absconditabacterales bacterium]
MTHLKKEEFAHLQKLANINLDDSEQEKFLEKLEPIISKLDELSKVDISDIKEDLQLDNTLRTLDGPKDFSNKKEIMDNVEHDIINNSVVIKSVLS